LITIADYCLDCAAIPPGSAMHVESHKKLTNVLTIHLG